MSRKKMERVKVQTGRERAQALAGYGAAMQLDRHGAHRARVVPDKRREANRRACRGRSD